MASDDYTKQLEVIKREHDTQYEEFVKKLDEFLKALSNSN